MSVLPQHRARAPAWPAWLLLSLAGSRSEAALAATGTADVARPAAPALLLARTWDPSASPAAYLVSEKYDGVRALWDGRQLRFRSGAEIPAPAWFLARLPAQALDGELWLARGRFDALSAIVRKARPVDAEWRQLHYLVFELPGAAGPFVERAARLRQIVRQSAWSQLEAVEQAPVDDAAALRQRLDAVLAAGGEGLVLHAAAAPYQTGRGEVLFKFKPVEDAEGQVVGHQPGRGKYQGLLGALRVRNGQGQVFLIGSGLSDAQRRDPPPVGSTITYSWRGLSAGGLPRFATLLRSREAGW